MNQQQFRLLIRQQIQTIKTLALLIWNSIKDFWYIYGILLLISIQAHSYYRDFPEHLRHIEPSDWQPHQSQLLDKHIRNLVDVRPKILNDSLVSVCPDILIDSKQNLICVNQHRQIVRLNTKNSVSERLLSERLYTIQEGKTQGLILSTDENYLYFVNSGLGLCQFSLKDKKVSQLVSEYQGQFLMSLNGVEVHPENPNLIYFTQSSKIIPMQRFSADIFLGNPFGRVFQYNKEKDKLRLLADGLHFPNGIVFQKYKNEDTLLVAETSRFRVTRIYIDGEKRGNKEVAVQKLDIYPDNLKLSEKGELLIGAMGIKQPNFLWFSQSSWMKTIYSRIPTQRYTKQVSSNYFGGARVELNEKGKNAKIEYLLWNHFQNYEIVSTIFANKNKLYISSFQNMGIIMIEDFENKLNTTQKNKANSKNSKRAITPNADGYFEPKNLSIWGKIAQFVEEHADDDD